MLFNTFAVISNGCLNIALKSLRDFSTSAAIYYIHRALDDLQGLGQPS